MSCLSAGWTGRVDRIPIADCIGSTQLEGPNSFSICAFGQNGVFLQHQRLQTARLGPDWSTTCLYLHTNIKVWQSLELFTIPRQTRFHFSFKQDKHLPWSSPPLGLENDRQRRIFTNLGQSSYYDSSKLGLEVFTLYA
jgi:hypothetical protein